MASRQNLRGRGFRGGRGGGYGGGTLGRVYGGPANLVNPKMEQWRAQQKSSKGIDRTSAAQARIARAQQTGVGRGTQEQIVRHTTPGGGGYNRAEAIARERQLASRPEAEQIAMLGRKANPNAGRPGAEKFDSGLEGKSLEGAINGGGPLKQADEWTPERKQRWREEQEDLKNPFGPRMRKGESGQWSAEQKAAYARGETPRQQLAGITGGQAGIDRAMRRMAANEGRAMPTGGAAEPPWEVEARERQAAQAKTAAARPRNRQTMGQRVQGIGQGFRKMGGFMNRARQAALAKRGPGMSGTMRPAVEPRRMGRRTTVGGTAPKRRTGGLGGALKSPRSRGLRGRGIGRGMGGTL